MTLPGVPETPERWEGLRTPRREGSGAPGDASRRDETGDGGAGRSRATATVTASDAGRRTPETRR